MSGINGVEVKGALIAYFQTQKVDVQSNKFFFVRKECFTTLPLWTSLRYIVAVKT